MLSFASAASLSLSLSSPLRPMRSAARAPSVVMADMAVLFDCDGVLADTERDGHRVSFNKVFGEKGYSFEWGVDEYGKLCEVGGGKERMPHYFDIHGWPEGLQDVADTSLVKPKGLPVDAGRLALVTEMHKRKTALFMELINEGTIPLRPGVLAIVDEAIAADVPLAVCSTSNEAAVRTLVETQMGAERYAKFSFFCGDAVARKKPQPDVYNLAAETMGRDKAECVGGEDSGIGLQASGAAQFVGAQFGGAQFACAYVSLATTRSARYSSAEIRFNLMAVVASRAEELRKQLAALPAGDAQRGMLEAEIASEDAKAARWKQENVRRRHNYVPFLVNLLKELAAAKKLKPLIDAAKAKQKPAGAAGK